MKRSAVPPVLGSPTDASTLRTLDELPGPRGLPLLGNALDIKPKELHRLVSGWAERFGSMYVFRVATTRILTVSDVETIQQLLRDRPERFRRWRKIEQIAADIKADELFTAEGENWRRQCKFLMHALNAIHVREFIPRLEKVVGRLRRRWWREVMAGRTVRSCRSDATDSGRNQWARIRDRHQHVRRENRAYPESSRQDVSGDCAATDRRTLAVSIDFPDRRVADRRKQTAASIA